MINFGKQILVILSRFGLKKFYFLICLFVILPVIELLGITSILGFIKVLLGDESGFSSFKAFKFFKFENHSESLIYLGIIVFLIIVFRNLLVIFIFWFKINYFSHLGYFLAGELLKNYFKQDYNFFLKHNSSVLVKNVAEETYLFANGLVSSIVQIISSLIVSMSLLAFVLYYNFLVSLIVISIVGGFYFIYFLITKSKILRLGHEKLKLKNDLYQTVSQSLQGIKEIKIFNLENIFLNITGKIFRASAKNLVGKNVITLLPRHIIEIIIFFAILLGATYNASQGLNINKIIEVLSVYILVGYRTIPYVENLFQSLARIKFSLPTVNLVKNQLELQAKFDFKHNESKKEKLEFNDKIQLENVSFSYNKNEEEILKNVNLSIRKNNLVAIVGKTGSGKTTLLNILLGMLKLTDGNLSIDGKKINNLNLKQWQNNLGFVPQDVYLFESSIYNNVSLYREKNPKNLKKIDEATKKAKIYDYIENLTNKSETLISERGSNLSGGQKQRLAIARAIFADPEILIFDEATSNLDGETANSFIETLINLKKLKKTIIMVTHDMKLAKNCDQIIFLKKGNIEAHGSYQELIENYEDFKALTNL